MKTTLKSKKSKSHLEHEAFQPNYVKLGRRIGY